MDEVGELIQSLQNGTESVAEILLREMAAVVYGSNTKARRGLGLDETLKLCMLVFSGQLDIDYSDRTPEYQVKLEKLIRKDINPGDNHIIRSRREVVQHAAAFQHIVNEFVHAQKPMTEKLIKDTHAILVKGISAAGAGFLDTSKDFGGKYRSDDVYIGVQQCPKPSEIAAAMTSMVKNLGIELDAAEKAGVLDPFALAAKYCDRFVNIHPFRDGNGRMCRLVLNVILIKYAGIVVNVGEHDQSRDEYLSAAEESRAVGGHAGPLATLVLREGYKTLKKMRDTLRKYKTWGKQDMERKGRE
ncbi:fic/DOC family protein [Lasiosphaeria ovina]|uniref:Fic/DOC family protein n=1 Tax=Lasiosphaeria ovina TaxID=92902 RepID=A0AAE0K4U0_9PEZI|nr:fic/DOC family protein [Lasiosphaeria ovina]